MILSICPNPSIDAYAWLDQLEPGKVNRISAVREYPGGKGTHIAFTLQELEADTRLLGLWAGASGERIRKKCEERNIETVGLSIPGDNRKCYTFRSSQEQFNNTELLEPGPKLSDNDILSLLDVCGSQFQKSDLICIAGSWPEGAPDDAYATLIGLAAEAGKNIIVDCSGIQLKNALKHQFFGIHLNESEAMALEMGSLEQCLSELSRNIDLVAITRGKDGLWLSYNDMVIHAQVEVENIISTVGSGDCLTAGIAYAVSKGFKAEDVARYAVACGSANCLSEGIGQVKINDVESLLPQVRIKVLAYDH